jgi:hypothetical protein
MSELLDNEQLTKKDSSKAELKAFAEQQYKELVKLLEINKKLEEEVVHLKKMVTSNDSFLIKTPQILTNEELICIEQIRLLKVSSELGPLTLEECKKFSEYVKTLKSIRSKEQDKDAPLKQYSTDELLKMVEDV